MRLGMGGRRAGEKGVGEWGEGGDGGGDGPGEFVGVDWS